MFLPTPVWGEKNGSMTNLEGRVMRLARLVTPEGTTMDDWRIAAELALRFGTDFGLDTVEDVQDEIARVAPAYAGVDAELLGRARDGAVVQIADHPGEIVFHRVAGISAGVSWEPIPPTPAIASEPGDGTADTDGSETADADAGRRGGRGSRRRPLPVGPGSQGTGRSAARRVQSPPRGCPHALRRRSDHRVESLACRRWHPVPRSSCTRTTSPGSASPPSATPCGSRARAAPSRCRCAPTPPSPPAPCFMPFAQSDTIGPNDLIDVTTSVTELRVETTR